MALTPFGFLFVYISLGVRVCVRLLLNNDTKMPGIMRAAGCWLH